MNSNKFLWHIFDTYKCILLLESDWWYNDAFVQDCKACAANEDCKGPVVFIVDIGSVSIPFSLHLLHLWH